MAPARKAPRGSNNSEDATTDSIPLAITQRQKQALMDNLQLEVTERARKLRAQYALQAQSLQTRIELRVNRIPTGIRKLTMGELLLRHEESMKAQQIGTTSTKTGTSKPSAKAASASTAKTRAAASPAPMPRGLKRTSDVMDGEDKENTPDPSYDVTNPKKRAKAGPNGGHRAPNPSTVLSPKSSNSRDLPHSPVRQPLGSSTKATSARPASPLKGTASTNSLAVVMGGEKPRTTRPAATATAGRKPAAKANTSTASTRAKRGTAAAATAERAMSSGSNTSGISTGTTIVKKASRGLLSTNAAAKKVAAATTAAARRAVPKAQAPTASTAAKRSLRKRA